MPAAVAAPLGVAVTATVATASTQWVMSRPSLDPYRSLRLVWESWARGSGGRVARKCQPRSPPSGQVDEELLGSPGLNRGGRGLRSWAFLRTWLRSRGCGSVPRPALLPLPEKHLGPPFPSTVTQCTVSLHPKDCASEGVRGRSSFSPPPSPPPTREALSLGKEQSWRKAAHAFAAARLPGAAAQGGEPFGCFIPIAPPSQSPHVTLEGQFIRQ